MTSTPIKDVNLLINYVSAGSAGKAADNLAGNFTDAFGRASGQNTAQDIKLPENQRKNGQMKVNQTDKKGLEGSRNTEKAQKPQEPASGKKAEEALEEAGTEIAEAVAEELGVSVEQVEAAMEMLGLTFADLLNADVMTQLVLTIEGADMLSLMTDEGLYNSLQNLIGTVNETVNVLETKLGLTEEELSAILAQAKAGNGADREEPVFRETDGKQPPETAAGQEDYTVTVEKDGEVSRVSVKVDGSSESEHTEIVSEKVQAPEHETENRPDKREHSQGKESFTGDGAAQSNMLLENLLNKTQQTQADAAFNTAMAEQAADTKDIMNQIMDYMKIQVKADLTQMEIQLHPASLGTVNINITSKEGVITAQFFAQNETVKAAIESQLVQLRTSFEEQGLKVEAVEVTIASHEFERNLSGGSGGQEHSAADKKKPFRKINLNELSGLEEPELDEAEQIAVEMMTAGGNTVDFTA